MRTTDFSVWLRLLVSWAMHTVSGHVTVKQHRQWYIVTVQQRTAQTCFQFLFLKCTKTDYDYCGVD